MWNQINHKPRGRLVRMSSKPLSGKYFDEQKALDSARSTELGETMAKREGRDRAEEFQSNGKN